MLRNDNTIANGDLTRLTWLAGAALALFGAVLLAVVAFAGWSANETAFERERTLIENSLNQSIERVLNEQKSVAWWDTSVLKFTDNGIDYDFADNEFGAFLTETYGQDQIFVLNKADQPIYAFAHNQRMAPNQFEHFRSAVAPLLAEVRTHEPSTFRHRPDMFGAGQTKNAYLPDMKHTGWAGHILSIDGRPAVVGAITIVPNVDFSILTGPPMILLSVTYVDEGFVSDIGRSLLLADLHLTPAPMSGNDLVSEPFVADDGVAVGYLTWTTKHPGQVLLRVILPLVAIALVAAGAAFANMLLGLRRASRDLERSELQARHEALHDSLSGLPNRQHFLLRLETLLEGREQNPRQKILVAYIDVDRFKDINDTMGHHAGDALIKAVAQRLSAQKQPEDFLARFGGDEFAILRAAGRDGGDALARRMAQAFEAPFSIEGQIVRVTASIGIASAPEHGESTEELMQHADIALYEAKSQGRDCAILFASSMGEKIARRRLIEVELRAAIENDTLDLHYQPLISAKTGKISGAEALLRWTHPTYGPIPPASFIPVAEEFGLMGALGDWVLRRAMRQAKQWPDLEISINLSPVQFRHPHLPAHLSELARQAGVPPSQIVLEITEGVLMESSKRTKETLESIRTMGFKLALDDFGTGYSSLAYLCQFKFDKIKIDRSFVAGFARGEVPRIVLTAVVALGNGLGMSIVAEGVETEFDALAMRHFGCTDMQGYFFSKAVDSKSLDTLLKTGIEDPLQAHAAL